MELAPSRAHIDESQLHVIYVWVSASQKIQGGISRLPAEHVNLIFQKIRPVHEQWFDELLANLPFEDSRLHPHLLKGEAGNLIPCVAQREHIDVIVMGTVCRTGVAGFFVGKTAERALRLVDCSVLTVKPQGFVTPVSL